MHALSELIITFGYIGIFITIFAESGFLFGFFLPGDSLLFTLGILSSQGIFDIRVLIPLLMIAAIFGDSFGYWMGKTFGPKLFERQNSRFFKKEYLTKTEEYFKKHGKKTIIIARFVPIVRTFAPIMAGTGHMHYKTFLAYNVIGGIAWTAGITLLAYFLGTQIPWIKDYIELIILGILFISILPVLFEIRRGLSLKKETEPENQTVL